MEVVDKASDHGSDDAESIRGGNGVGFSGPLISNSNKKSSKKSARFKDQESSSSYVEITLDVRDDSVMVQNIKGADSQETALLASQLMEKKPSSLGSQLSFRLRQITSNSTSSSRRKIMNRADRTRSGAAHALRGLQFISKTVGNEGWSQVENRFHELAVNGLLPKSSFGQCIGLCVFPNSCLKIYFLSISYIYIYIYLCK